MQRILIVDDELLVADTIAIIFRAHGFEVRTAYSAAEALRLAHAFQPELLVCEINMPDRTGLELMQDIGNELPNCKMIVLTAHHFNRAIVSEQARRMPQTPTFLIKPCHPLELLREAGAILTGA
jgi:CheY-like chemotaxis protein